MNKTKKQLQTLCPHAKLVVLNTKSGPCATRSASSYGKWRENANNLVTLHQDEYVYVCQNHLHFNAHNIKSLI